MASAAFAGPIDIEKARERATGFWSKRSNSTLVPLKAASKANSRWATRKSDPAFYIFTPANERGFVIVSGDDELAPIVGYSDNEVPGEMPPALLALLDEYEMYVDEVRAGRAVPTVMAATGKAIAPMLETTWDQGSPYNIMCPQINGSYAPTGCTATAMAQIMKFHEWPEKPSKGITWHNNITGKDEYVNISNHKYDWDAMLPGYRNGYTQEQANAVALLMADVGKAINSNYSLAGTGSSEIYASYALVNVFRYSPEVAIVRRSEFTEEEYFEIIRENLEARQPLMYTGHGQSYSSGHAFVCDGIDENNLLHIDWGWSGSYNGYFDITYMTPSGTGIGGGDGRYNVAQTLVANIRPRQDGEKDVPGVPCVYMMDVVDATATGTPSTLLEQTAKYDKNGVATIKIAAGLLNWSHSDIKLSMYIGFEKDGEMIDVSKIGDEKVTEFNGDIGYYITLTVSNDPNSEEHLEKGVYRLVVCYSDDSGENIYLARGAENGLIVEVNDASVTVRKELPAVEMANITYHTTPQMKGDRLAFDAEFRTTNGKSADVLIVPVVNKLQEDGTYTSTILKNVPALVQVYDNRNILVSFSTGYIMPDNGKYFISFKYNIRNYFINHSTDIEEANLIDIAGKSDDIDISPLPDGLVLSTTALSASPGITWGEKAEISASVENISSSDDSFTGTLGISLKEKNSGQEHVIATTYVENLKRGESIVVKSNNNDYFPVVKPGNYYVTVRKLEEDGWKEIRQSATTCTIGIANTSATIPYVCGKITVNEGNDVVQGSTFKAKATLGCVNGDFEGYVRVNIAHGLSYNVRSEYVAVSLKEGETTEVTFDCTSKATMALGKYRLAITYHNADEKKTKIGDVSNNTLTNWANGYFWVCNETAVEDVRKNEAAVSAGRGCIVVEGEDATTVVYTCDGREVYRGTANTIAVESGLYVVAVQDANGSTAVAKVLVK